MKSTRVPIDNCPHTTIAYDDVADQEYCTTCGLIFSNDEEGWLDATQNGSFD